MSLSPEVAAAVEEIRRNNSLSRSLLAASKLQGEKIADLQAKIDAIPVGQNMSQEDKDALQKEVSDLDLLNDELETATKANTAPVADGVASAGSNPKNDPIPAHGEDGAPTDSLTSGDVLAANGPANHPAGGTVPMMPTSAFDPGAGSTPGPTESGFPVPKAIETPGGFVIAGGGSVQRAPGSDPTSPSSSVTVPLDPDAKGAASTADVAKSGLGDSSQNALLGNDGRPVSDGPGMPKEPTQADQDAAQKQQDALAAEKEAKEANPLNLAPAGTPQAGSVDMQGNAMNKPALAPAMVDETKPNAPAA